MYFRFRDFFINLIPVKSIRRLLKYRYGTFPYCNVSKKTKIKKSKVSLGKDIFIGDDCDFTREGFISIGSYTRIAKKVTILTSNHNFRSKTMIPFDETDYVQDVSIGECCWIGYGAIICPGVKLEEGVVVAAGSVVTKSVPKCAIVAGNPAKIIGYREISVYDSLKSESKYASTDDLKNRKLVKLEGYKELLEG